jgi:hypothetical protein
VSEPREPVRQRSGACLAPHAASGFAFQGVASAITPEHPSFARSHVAVRKGRCLKPLTAHSDTSERRQRASAVRCGDECASGARRFLKKLLPTEFIASFKTAAHARAPRRGCDSVATRRARFSCVSLREAPSGANRRKAHRRQS